MHAPDITQFCYGEFASYQEAELYAYQRLAFRHFELFSKDFFDPKFKTVLDNLDDLPTLKQILNEIKSSEHVFSVSVIQQNKPVEHITSQHVDKLREQVAVMEEYYQKSAKFYKEQLEKNEKLMIEDKKRWMTTFHAEYKRSKYDHSFFDLALPVFEPIFKDDVMVPPADDEEEEDTTVCGTLSLISSVVLRYIEDYDRVDKGLGLKKLMQLSHMDGYDTTNLKQMMDTLINDGKVYTTVDDDHFKSTFNY